MGKRPPFALINGRVLIECGLHEDLAVLVEGSCIAAVVAQNDPRAAAVPQHDLDGGLLLPGFIDVQVNGGGGLLFNDTPSVTTLRSIAATHRRFGTTGLLPTLITDTKAKMRMALETVDTAMEQGVPGILGIHLEGPFLAPSHKGIHDSSLFRQPDADDLTMLCARHHGKLMLTLAPEQVVPATLRHLVQAGVIVAAGHTAADHATIRMALDAGLSGFTHLYNAMTPLSSREPGVVGAALEDPHSWCGLVVDGHHVHPASLRVAIAAKPRGKCVLVTDAMPPAGSDIPSYVLGGQPIMVRDNQCQNNAGVLAGSSLDMATGVRNLVQQLGLPLAEAARMASTYPAAWLGLQHTHGRITTGYRADFVVLDDDLKVRETWIGGVAFPNPSSCFK